MASCRSMNLSGLHEFWCQTFPTKKLKRLFKEVDKDNSKYIDVDELLNWVFGSDKVMLNVGAALDAEKVEDEETDEIIRELKEKRARNKQAEAEHGAFASKGRRKPERQNGEEAFREELAAFLQSSNADDMNDCEAILARGERLGVSAVALKPLRDRIKFILERYGTNRARCNSVKQRERDREEGVARARHKSFIKDELWDG